MNFIDIKMDSATTKKLAFASYIINRLGFITEMGSVYCAVRTESLHNSDKFRP